MFKQKNHWRSAAALLALFLMFLTALEFGLQKNRQIAKQEAGQSVLDLASRLRVWLESEINGAVFQATGVETYIVARRGEISPGEIEVILALVYERGRHFRNIGVAPGNEIRWVFPEEGNEAVIGVRYQDLPGQWPAVSAIIERGRGSLVGPLELVQGGQGLIYRAPIFIDGVYWGLLSTVIDVDSLLEVLASTAGPDAGSLALRVAPEGGGEGNVFWGAPTHFDDPLAVFSLTVPGGEWQLAVKPAPLPVSGLWYSRFVAFWVALALAFTTFLILRSFWQRNMMRRLEANVRERTLELRNSNELLESVLDAARSFAIVATDTRGKVTLFNRGAERMLGYHAGEVVGLHELTLFMQNEELREHLRQVSGQTSGPNEAGELGQTDEFDVGAGEMLTLRYRHREGHLVPVQVVISGIRDDSGKLQGFLAIAEDISERQRNELLKNQFISTVSHELRTPLTAIRGALGLVNAGATGEVPEGLRPMIEVAHANSGRLAQLVDDLLDIEKLMSGHMVLYTSAEAPLPLVEDVIQTLDVIARNEEVSLRLEGSTRGTIMVDRARFQQVLTNLVGNAIKFSSAGGSVTVRLEDSGLRLRISVQDQGPGIKDSFRARIFDRFAQDDASDTRNKPGTGLGLAISKELTEQMGGIIGFDSAPGQGSRFWVEFPTVEEDVDG